MRLFWETDQQNLCHSRGQTRKRPLRTREVSLSIEALHHSVLSLTLVTIFKS
jgi:hypothetical protein